MIARVFIAACSLINVNKSVEAARAADCFLFLHVWVCLAICARGMESREGEGRAVVVGLVGAVVLFAFELSAAALC